MNDRLPIAIVTPEKIAWEGTVDSVILPAHDGMMGILPHHAPMLCQLREGAVRLKDGAEERFLAVSQGFVQVEDGRLSIFAETAESASEIDAERARQAVERARAGLKDADGQSQGPDESALRRAVARLKVARLSGRRGAARPPV